MNAPHDTAGHDPGFLRGLARAFSSWRTASVALLSFSSGLPLGLVWYTIPDWLRSTGADIRLVGLLTLAQAPWSFKFLWAPLMDRWAPPFLGRRRGWAALAQIVLAALTVGLGGAGGHPDAPWIVFAVALAIALASATQDIAVDAYAVDVLRREEQGIAVGARIALYRMAMFLAGSFAITWTARLGWPATCAILGAAYLPMLLVTRHAPEPPRVAAPPRTLREAVWLPFLGFLSRHRAIEILAFVLLYKLADNLSQSLLRPFLQDMGYDAVQRGVALGTVGMVATVGGTFLGGALTGALGLGRALWWFGFLQIASNLGYILLARSPPNPALMYGAMTFETVATGLGMGAFSVLLLRMTQKRFSATQYALFSSLFGVPRIVAGPVTGAVVHAVGWEPFFWLTMVAGVPGMVLLARFVPWGVREPTFDVDPPRAARPLGRRGIALRGLLGGGIGGGTAALAVGALRWLEPGASPRSFVGALASILRPTSAGDAVETAGIVAVALVLGLFTAAAAVARRRPLGGGTDLDVANGDAS
jgi:PAT family beta-lactamase induction signal transducer AmpG